MDDIIKMIYDIIRYNIENYKYYNFKEFINLPEFIMLVGLSIMVKDFRLESSYKIINELLLINRDLLVHHNDITKIKDKDNSKLYNITIPIFNNIINELNKIDLEWR